MKRAGILLIVLGLLAGMCLSVSAEGTGKAYVYNHSEQSMKIPDPYTAEQVLDSGRYGWAHPVDVRGRDGYLYVLDTAGQMLVLDGTDYSLIRTFGFTRDGQPYHTEEPKSFWIDADGTILVADRSGKMVFRTDPEGQVIQEYPRPATDLLDENVDYLPRQVLTDSLGYVYIMAENQYRGIFKLDREGNFITFYGSKSVDVTASLLLDMLWRNFMTDAQIDNSQRYLPTEYNSMAIDADGFIYTTSATSSDRDEWVAKLNSLGSNVLRSTGEFGDYDLGCLYGKWYYTDFTSVAVDDDSYITVLDDTWNRLFQYSQEGELLYVFGGRGEQQGTFEEASCVRSIGEKLFVCDSAYGTVTVWEPTAFGKLVREADGLYQNGLFTESAAVWEQVLDQCQNYEYAFIGMGKAAYIQKDYTTAMRYFKLGYDRDEYSMAFSRYRSALLRRIFIPVLIGLAALIVLLIVGKSLYRKHRPARTDAARYPKLRYMFYTLVHPIEGFQELRYNHLGSPLLASVVIVLYFLISCFSFAEKGFIFNSNEPGSFNIWVILATTVGLAFAFALVNWLLAVFFDGKGRLKEVWMTIGYALVPSMFALLIELILSRVLIAGESAFLYYVITIGTIWSVAVFILGIKEIHQYSFTRNLLSLFVSVLGILILLFLLFLMISLFVQVSDFVKAIFEETMYRIRVGF